MTDCPHTIYILCILDGWGYSKSRDNNAIAAAHTPNFDSLFEKNHAFLKTSGSDVGLPDGQFGNSEVGHMTIGSGKVVKQDLVRINETIETGALGQNAAFSEFITISKTASSVCHIVGLLSDGGVHSHIDHILALAKFLKDKNIKVILHAILDGRDVAPQSALKYISQAEANSIEICSISGRYYAMDRDERISRTTAYYDALCGNTDEKFSDAKQFINDCYLKQIYDEFIPPAKCVNYPGIQDGDSILFANFRADRMRQIANIVVNSQKFSSLGSIASLTEYSESLARTIKTLFPKDKIKDTLGSVISNLGKKQLRIAETEKYAHITYFLNGGTEQPYHLEDRILIPSPKVASYDIAPSMSAYQVTDALISAVKKQYYDFICLNFANADMVGHTGNFYATKIACETIDKCIGYIIDLSKEYRIELLVTADHGNAEELFDFKDNQPHTAHTMNDVPIVYHGMKNIGLLNGSLADIAPTILELMAIAKPESMTGKSLIRYI